MRKMTDKNLTEIVAIIDRSGSMSSLVAETIGGFNNFLEEQKKTGTKATFTLVQFDDKYQIDYNGVDINDVKPLDDKTYVPRGMTALFDAVGKTVTTVGERLAKTDEDKRPGQVIFLVITDGEENSSHEYEGSKIRQMVKHQIDKYSWSFVYMGGGNLETQQLQGRALGIGAANVYSYDLTATPGVYSSLTKGVARRRLDFAAGMAVSADAALLNQEEVNQLTVESKK